MNSTKIDKNDDEQIALRIRTSGAPAADLLLYKYNYFQSL